MLRIYDLYCPECGAEKLDVIKHYDELVECSECGYPMKHVCNTTSFSLKYNPQTDICDWDGNTTQYWNEYKKQKAEGKNVRISQLDGDS